jgi:hypothetical protein
MDRAAQCRPGGGERVGDRVAQPRTEAGRLGTQRRGRITSLDPVQLLADDERGALERAEHSSSPSRLSSR